MTGQWEKKLRGIENGSMALQQFISELKAMVQGIVEEVKQDASGKRVEIADDATKLIPKEEIHAPKVACPKCGKGEIIRGKSAYGCNLWKDGCNYRVDFIQFGKKITAKQFETLFSKGKTNEIKKFKKGEKELDGKLILEGDGTIMLLEKEETKAICPICATGEIIRGNNSFGCSNFANGCKFRLPFEFGSKKLTKKIILQLTTKGVTNILSGVNIENTMQNGRFMLDNGTLKFEKS